MLSQEKGRRRNPVISCPSRFFLPAFQANRRSLSCRRTIGARARSSHTMPIASTRFSSLAPTQRITNAATRAILNWRRNLCPDAARVGGVSASIVRQQHYRKRLQVEPADSFGVIGTQPMPLDTVLAEFVPASVPFAFAETGHRRTSITIRASAADAGRGASEEVGIAIGAPQTLRFVVRNF
jgi:hypothetical protein